MTAEFGRGEMKFLLWETAYAKFIGKGRTLHVITLKRKLPELAI